MLGIKTRLLLGFHNTRHDCITGDILSVTRLLMSAPIISPISKVSVESPYWSTKETLLKRENLKRGATQYKEGFFQNRNRGSVTLCIYIYGVFNFTKLKIFTIFFFLLKFALAIFHFFHQIIALKILWKMFFISFEKVLSYCKKYFLFHLKRSFCSWYIQISVFPLFSLSVNALIWSIIRIQ